MEQSHTYLHPFLSHQLTKDTPPEITQFWREAGGTFQFSWEPELQQQIGILSMNSSYKASLNLLLYLNFWSYLVESFVVLTVQVLLLLKALFQMSQFTTLCGKVRSTVSLYQLLAQGGQLIFGYHYILFAKGWKKYTATRKQFLSQNSG